jgi:hypothetical protein
LIVLDAVEQCLANVNSHSSSPSTFIIVVRFSSRQKT